MKAEMETQGVTASSFFELSPATLSASLNDVTNVTSVAANLTNATSLEGEFQFNRRLLLNVIAYSIMFVVGTIGNTVVSNPFLTSNNFDPDQYHNFLVLHHRLQVIELL